MPFNGSGTFVRIYSWQTDKANGIKIRADRMDGETDGIATGLTDCVTRDGQSPATANLPMGAFKHTGVAAAASKDDYLRADQLQKMDLAYFTSAGVADVYTLTPSPAVTAYAGGQTWKVKWSATNLTTTPTINVSGLGAVTIVNGDGTAVAASDLLIGGVSDITYEATAAKFFLVNKTSPYSLPATVQQWVDLGTQIADYSFGGTADSKLQMYCNTTSGLALTLPKNAAHGRLLMLVKAGAYTLNLCGTINNVGGTVGIFDRQTLPMTYNTTEGWL